MDEPHLAGLTNAFAVSESLPTEQAGGLVDVGEGTEVEH